MYSKKKIITILILLSMFISLLHGLFVISFDSNLSFSDEYIYFSMLLFWSSFFSLSVLGILLGVLAKGELAKLDNKSF